MYFKHPGVYPGLYEEVCVYVCTRVMLLCLLVSIQIQFSIHKIKCQLCAPTALQSLTVELMSPEKWKKVIRSDESSFTIVSSRECVYVWHTPRECYRPESLNTRARVSGAVGDILLHGLGHCISIKAICMMNLSYIDHNAPIPPWGERFSSLHQDSQSCSGGLTYLRLFVGYPLNLSPVCVALRTLV